MLVSFFVLILTAFLLCQKILWRGIYFTTPRACPSLCIVSTHHPLSLPHSFHEDKQNRDRNKERKEHGRQRRFLSFICGTIKRFPFIVKMEFPFPKPPFEWRSRDGKIHRYKTKSNLLAPLFLSATQII